MVLESREDHRRGNMLCSAAVAGAEAEAEAAAGTAFATMEEGVSCAAAGMLAAGGKLWKEYSVRVEGGGLQTRVGSNMEKAERGEELKCLHAVSQTRKKEDGSSAVYWPPGVADGRSTRATEGAIDIWDNNLGG